MNHPLRRFTRHHHRAILVFASIGVLAIAIFFYAIFIVHNGTPTPITIERELVSGTPDFIKTLSRTTNSPIENGGSVEILTNGDEFVPDLLDEIATASSSINFSTYIWEEGEFSRMVLTALTDATKRGVSVRVLLDGISGNPPEEELKVFKDAGGEVAIFNPVFSDPFSINNRNHRRAITMDGDIGYIGGIAIADTWLGGGKEEDEWRDSMYKLHGTMAQSLDSAFADQWLATTGEILAVPDIAPAVGSSTFMHIIGSAGNKNRPISAAFLLTALSAQKSLYISNPYVLPDEALRSVLTEKARSGVDVRILVPGPKTDAPVVRWASQYYYRELLDAGVRIYEYQPSLLHEKSMVADGIWSLVGSANIDNRSAELNDENVMGIENENLAGRIIDNFYEDLQRSLEITPEAWRDQSILHKTISWSRAYHSSNFEFSFMKSDLTDII